MHTSFYQSLLDRKKTWTPQLGSNHQVLEGAEDTIGKCLALRILEISVGEWIADGCKRELSKLPETVIKLLQSNIEDEARHDEALYLATKTCNLTTKQMDADAASLAEEWINHPDHPIVKAGVIESSVFFVILPIFRFMGGPNLRTVSADISNDETIHVSANRQLALDLKQTYSPSLNRLRQRTIEWLVSDLEAPGKWGNPQLWLDSSQSLLERGIAPQLTETKAGIMPAFFEHSNLDLPVYY